MLLTYGLGEPACLDGTFAAEYTMDDCGKWRVVCLSPRSDEDTENVYVFGFMFTCALLIGLGIAVVLSGNSKSWDSCQVPPETAQHDCWVGRVVRTQTVTFTHNIESILEKLCI